MGLFSSIVKTAIGLDPEKVDTKLKTELTAQATGAQATQSAVMAVINSNDHSWNTGNLQSLLLASDGRLTKKELKNYKQIERQESKTSRVALRTDAKKVAYQNGIDPTANAISAVGQGLGAIAGGLSGGAFPGASMLFPRPQMAGDSGVSASDVSQVAGEAYLAAGGTITSDDNSKIMLIGLGAIALLFLLKRK